VEKEMEMELEIDDAAERHNRANQGDEGSVEVRENV
jgi:hypothetical protein